MDAEGAEAEDRAGGVRVALGGEFASALPELGATWQARRFERPEILALNEDLARELRLDPEWLQSDRGLRFLLGNELPSGAEPVAQAYAGHQFGFYNPRLGDGRALLLGELSSTDGAVRDLHLKGSGPTPFSRGDGLAAVGPMLREYLMGEAMHALGVPTTRALAVVSTGERVMREESFDPLPGAVLVRTAASHLRVGSFQYARATGDLELLRRLADHAIARHYPALAESEEPYLGLLTAVVERQASLIASWMLVGFVHGVMNTDNTTISGETIDYGPCAFIDAYDLDAVFSSIDHRGRYAYGRQAGIGLWNLTRLAEALLPLLAEGGEAAKELALSALSRFGPAYDRAWLGGMRAKLGLAAAPPERLDDAGLASLTAAMLGELQAKRVDYTGFFRALAEAARGSDEELRGLIGAGVPDAAAGSGWLDEWLAHAPDAAEMDAVNPVYIPRNHLVDEALEAAANGDLSPFERLLGLLVKPFAVREGFERYEKPAPRGLRHVTYCGT